MAQYNFKRSAEKTYIPMPEGTYIFRISKLEIINKGQVCRGTFSTEDGVNHYEKYYFYDKDKKIKDNIVESVARIITGALQLDDVIEEFTEEDVKNCVGRYIEADIKHSKSDVTDRVYDHIDCFSIAPADGFTDEDTEDEAEAAAEAKPEKAEAAAETKAKIVEAVAEVKVETVDVSAEAKAEEVEAPAESKTPEVA